MSMVMEDGVKERLSSQAINIMTGLANSWGLSDEDVARLSGTTSIGYLMRLNGYEDRPLPESVVHRVTVLGNISRTLKRSQIDPAFWMTSVQPEAPFSGRTPLDTLATLDVAQLVAFHEELVDAIGVDSHFRPVTSGMAMPA